MKRIVITDAAARRGAVPPKGYAIAYRNVTFRTTIYEPVPMALLTRTWLRMRVKFWSWLARPLAILGDNREAYREGYLDGYSVASRREPPIERLQRFDEPEESPL